MTRKKARLALLTGIAIVVLAISATQAGESKDVAKRTELYEEEKGSGVVY